MDECVVDGLQLARRTMERKGAERAENRGEGGGDDGDDKRLDERVPDVWFMEQFDVPFHGETGPRTAVFAGVERRDGS